MTFSDEVAQYKTNYPGLKIRPKTTPLSISKDDEASCHEALADLIVPDGIVSGLTGVIVSNNITIQPGSWKINKILYLKISVSVFSLEAPDGTLSRYDLFYADAANNIQKATGALSATPLLPVLPDNTIQVCNVLIQPSGYTLTLAPDGDYVNTATNQYGIDGVKSFIRSPQIPNGVNAQDAVAFNQLASLTGSFLNNGIGPTTDGFFGLGGAPLIKETTLDLSTFDLFVTQGLQTSADFTTWFNTNDRAIVDAGYVRNSQNYKKWVTGTTVNAFNLYSISTFGSPELYLAKGSLSSGSNTVNPNVSSAAAFASSNTFSGNITAYLNWQAASNNFTMISGNYLLIQNSVGVIPTGSGMATFPLFSKPIGGLARTGGDAFSFTISGDGNDSVNFVYKFNFYAGSVPSDATQIWYELPAAEKDIDVIISNTAYQYRVHVDVARDVNNLFFEFRARVELLFNSGNTGAVQLLEIELKDDNALSFFNSRAVPSNFWKIKNTGTDPNTLLNQWFGTEAASILQLATNTSGIGPLSTYSIKTRGNTAIFNNITTTNIVSYQQNGTQLGYIDNNGAIFAPSINNPASATNSSVMLNAGGVGIRRGVNDAGNVLVVQNYNPSFSGSLFVAADYISSAMTVGKGGNNTTYINPYTVNNSGLGIQAAIYGQLVPTANGDTEIALDINPAFGKSKIATFDTLVGGTAYPNNATVAILAGGTGSGAVLSITVAGGVVQPGATLLRPGANYTIGDILTLQCFVNGVLTGTGATITVRTITSYTGILSYGIRVQGAASLFSPSTTSYSSVILPPGAVYTGTTSGAIWQDGTHLYAYINGAARQLDQQTGGGGTITAVSGTANRIGTSGTTSVTIDIASSYAGQSSINTVGTIGAGIWNGTAIADAYISSASTWNAKMNNPMTAAGDIIVGGTSGAPARLAKGTANQIPSINTAGTTLEYRTLAISAGLGGGYAAGLINLYLQDGVSIVTDANLTVTGSGNFYELPIITANRTINIGPASSSSGQKMIFLNKNTSTSFSWSFLGSGSVVDTLGNTITTLANGFIYTIESDGVNWVWLDNLVASTQYFVPGLFVGSVDPSTPTPGTIGNQFTLGPAVVGVSNLSATGTPSALNFLSGNNTWYNLFSSANTFSAIQTFNQAGNGNTPTDIVILGTATNATSGITVQESGAINFQNSTWNTSGTPSQNPANMRIYTRGTSGSSIINTLVIDASINGGGYANVFSINSIGQMAVGQMTTSGLTTSSTYVNKPSGVAVNTTATVTAANIGTQLFTSTTAAAVVATTPSANAIFTQLNASVGSTSRLTAINTGPNTFTIGLPASITAVSGITGGTNLVVAASAGGVPGFGVFEFLFLTSTVAVIYRIA